MLIRITVEKNSGNLLRLDYAIHKPYTNPFWHYHYRFSMFGAKYGSSAPHKIFTVPFNNSDAMIGIGAGTLHKRYPEE